MHLTDALSNPTCVKKLLNLTRDGALTKLLASKPRPVLGTMRRRRRLRQLSSADVDQLVRDYCDGAGSIDELAKSVGVSGSTVAKHLKARGLELGRLSMEPHEIKVALT